MVAKARQKIFISYSHVDEKWLKRMLVHLKPLERDGLIDPWSDRRLEPGMQWREEISRAIRDSRVAILLVSPDFLSSDFIHSDELPPILRAAEEQGTRIIQIVVSHCHFSRFPGLSKFQTVNNPDRPLNSLNRSGQDAILLKLAKSVEGWLTSSVPEPSLTELEEDDYSRLMRFLDRRSHVFTHDVFLALPMNSLPTEELYSEHHQIALSVADALKNHLGFNDICGAAIRNSTRREANPASLSIRDNLQAIKESRLFILLHTSSNLVSSSLVEAGIALALRIPSIYFVWKDAKLPFLLTRAAQAFPHVESYQCHDVAHLVSLIEKHRSDLLQFVEVQKMDERLQPKS